ncbi:Transposable element Tcb2 transposase [Nosema granulosis]|uniref:Transposable element Tcb2 transposase n=1 Tax=Nosema granulosis TaxID=83296 RepID=A0A9P6KYU7_9MICR|nr:Transposable element Tcb2 transposase [Nosema granulosis]
MEMFLISWSRKTLLIDGIMDAFAYVDVLANNLSAFADEMGLEVFIIQQDNDPKNTSKLSKVYFKNKDVDLLLCPSKSSDLKANKILWVLIKDELSSFVFNTKAKLKANGNIVLDTT